MVPSDPKTEADRQRDDVRQAVILHEWKMSMDEDDRPTQIDADAPEDKGHL